MKSKTIIFDFDGTIANSLEGFIEIYNQLAMQYNCRPVNSTDVPRLRQLGPKAVVKELKIPFWKLPLIIKKVLSQFNKNISQIEPQHMICDVIRQLHDQGYLIGIMTSNKTASVQSFLDNNGLDSIVSFVYSEKNVNGKDKALRYILHDKQINAHDSVYIGDEVRDMIAAKKVGMKTIAVSWGFNTKEALQAEQPDFIVDRPEQLLIVIEKL